MHSGGSSSAQGNRDSGKRQGFLCGTLPGGKAVELRNRRRGTPGGCTAVAAVVRLGTVTVAWSGIPLPCYARPCLPDFGQFMGLRNRILGLQARIDCFTLQAMTTCVRLRACKMGTPGGYMAVALVVWQGTVAVPSGAQGFACRVMLGGKIVTWDYTRTSLIGYGPFPEEPFAQEGIRSGRYFCT